MERWKTFVMGLRDSIGVEEGRLNELCSMGWHVKKVLTLNPPDGPTSAVSMRKMEEGAPVEFAMILNTRGEDTADWEERIRGKEREGYELIKAYDLSAPKWKSSLLIFHRAP